MNDYIFWLKNLPSNAQIGDLYPVGSLANENVKTGLVGKGLQRLIIPLKKKPVDDLPQHFLNPDYKYLPGLGHCMQFSWEIDGNPLIIEFLDDLLRTQTFLVDPVSVFQNKLKVWRDLLGEGGNSILNIVTGLWGELYVCIHDDKLGTYWTGPTGSDIDFQTPKFVFDVKTTRVKSSIIFSVSGLNQFEHQVDAYVVWLRIETGTEQNYSIADLLGRLDKDKISETVMNNINRIINRLPYTAVHDLKFVCREIRVFNTKNLPLITKKTLESVFENEASRVTRLSYQVNANGIKYQKLEQFLNSLI